METGRVHGYGRMVRGRGGGFIDGVLAAAAAAAAAVASNTLVVKRSNKAGDTEADIPSCTDTDKGETRWAPFPHDLPAPPGPSPSSLPLSLPPVCSPLSPTSEC